MQNIRATTIFLFLSILLITSVTSCVNTRKVAYFNDVKDSTLIASKESPEPLIQKKDILSIAVSSLSNEATVIFNTPNLGAVNNGSANNSSQTTGYLVNQ